MVSIWYPDLGLRIVACRFVPVRAHQWGCPAAAAVGQSAVAGSSPQGVTSCLVEKPALDGHNISSGTDVCQVRRRRDGVARRQPRVGGRGLGLRLRRRGGGAQGRGHTESGSLRHSLARAPEFKGTLLRLVSASLHGRLAVRPSIGSAIRHHGQSEGVFLDARLLMLT